MMYSTTSRKTRLNRAVKPVLETLETRRLLSSAVTFTTMGAANLATADATGDQQAPDVAFGGSQGVVVWTDDNGANGVDIKARRFDGNGSYSADAVTVNTTVAGNQDSPAVAVASDGSYAIAWADGNNVRARRFGSDGTAAGSDFVASTDSTNGKSNVAIGMNSSGAFVVTWDSAGQDGGGAGVYGQRFNSSGVAQGAEIPVNTTTTGNQQNSSVGVDSSGNFVVAWDSADSSSAGVWFQRFNSSGVAQGSETLANTEETDDQTTPDIAVGSSGSFVVAWESANQDNGGSKGVYFQRFNAAGAAQGSETRINSSTAGDQSSPSISLDSGGGFTAAFVDESSTPDQYLARRFNSSGSPITSPTQVANDVLAGYRANVAVISDTRFAVSIISSSGGTDDVSTNVTTSSLTVTGSGATITVGESGGQVVVTEGGSPTSFDVNFESLTVNGSSGADTITINDGLPGGISTITVDGGAGNDTITGSGSSETLMGGDGNDSIDAGGGDDRVYPGLGNDDVEGGAGTDTVTYQGRTENLTLRIDGGGPSGDIGLGETDTIDNDFENAVGGNGNDSITGNTGNNILGGVDGNDTLVSGLGTDTIFGDNGIDTVSYSTHSAAVTVTLDGAANDGATGENDFVQNDIENVIGGTGNDTITGDSNDNTLQGGNGNDVIDGGTGTDSMAGGAGTDTVSYASRSAAVTVTLGGSATNGESGENDTVASDIENATGGSGADTLIGSAGDNTLLGGNGNDSLIGNDGKDRIQGGSGSDVIDGGDSPDALYGQDGNDSVFAGTGADRVWGGSGNDRLKGGNNNDTIEGENGNDLIYGDSGNDSVTGGSNNDSVYGGDGHDKVFGSGGDDKLFGEAGNDTLNGSVGADRLDGGLNTDRVSNKDSLDRLVSIELLI